MRVCAYADNIMRIYKCAFEGVTLDRQVFCQFVHLFVFVFVKKYLKSESNLTVSVLKQDKKTGR